jgi:hypothetical protein
MRRAGEVAAIFGDALRHLSQNATYLYQDGSRYWYSTQPMVSKLAEDCAEQLKSDPNAILEEVRRRMAWRLIRFQPHYKPIRKRLPIPVRGSRVTRAERKKAIVAVDLWRLQCGKGSRHQRSRAGHRRVLRVVLKEGLCVVAVATNRVLKRKRVPTPPKFRNGRQSRLL